MEKTIEGKVAKILDEYSIVINVGKNNGSTRGMVFAVFTQSEDEIKDPDNNEVLGKLENIKEYVSVAHVQDKFSTCIAMETKTMTNDDESTGAQTLSGAMMAECMSAKPRGSILSTAKLNVNASQIMGATQLEPISVGNSVRAV